MVTAVVVSTSVDHGSISKPELFISYLLPHRLCMFRATRTGAKADTYLHGQKHGEGSRARRTSAKADTRINRHKNGEGSCTSHSGVTSAVSLLSKPDVRAVLRFGMQSWNHRLIAHDLGVR